MAAKYMSYVPARREQLQFNPNELSLKRSIKANRGCEIMIWINVPGTEDYTLAIHVDRGAPLPEYKELDAWIKDYVG
ncbi:hypothetical protein SEA_NICEHOUSE_125 [Rhodococcus phage NiceHouse]|nr:hypothetical protein SEA_NICEHOUSE_125 [Rhodococcus phage NiceHouse]